MKVSETNTEPHSQRPPILGPEASAVSFARMATFPEPGWHIPRHIAYSPDGKLVTYLQSEAQDEKMALFALDTQTKQQTLLVRASALLDQDKPMSRDEELRRERQRQRIQGITSYAWAKRANVMLIPFAGDVFVRKEDGALVRLTSSSEPEIDPQICDTGEKIAFVRKGELHVLDIASKVETQLTKGAPDGVTRGLSDFNGQEEFGEKSGFWMSPRCEHIAYLEVDEREVATTHIVGYRGGVADYMPQRYPIAGQKNPIVRMAMVNVATKKTQWLTYKSSHAGEQEHYFGRFQWSDDGKALWFQALSRDQKRLVLLRADPKTGAITEVLTETSPTWVEFSQMRLLQRSPKFVWTTVVDGHRHAEVRDAQTGNRLAQITSGSWDIEAIMSVDEDKGRLFLLGSKDSPLELHLYTVPLGGGAVERVTQEQGSHLVVIDPKTHGYVDVHSALDRPPKAIVKDSSGVVLGDLPSPLDPDLETLKLRTPEMVTIKGPSGDTLYGALLRPKTMEAGKRYPVVVMIYGGPGAQTVVNQWSPRLMWQHLADRGFVVFQLDNRGSAGRGPGFEAPLYGRFGQVELEDQLAGVDFLGTLPFVDSSRIGIYGHSYGGFMAALAILKAPDRFQVAVAGSPVTDFRLYDTGYTERYMGLPDKNPAGYDAANINKLASNLKGKLFLIHALMDENVHFQNTAHLIEALVAADKPFDMLLFPGERHGYRNPVSRRYALRRVVDYFVEHL